ncbi:MAG: flagellar M-ring protein FliF [Candidatus Hydrogenedentota bacterium]|nr:MAG: flagellar M-ring protein FliF [Candidatus Hydrogenedentota bacterium]
MNEFFQRILGYFRELWGRLTPGQRITSGVLLGATILLFAGILMMASKTVWVELGTFELQEAAQIKTELDKRGYTAGKDYRLSNGGRTIEVDAKKRNEIHLALAEKGLFGHAEKGFSIFEKFDITTTDYEQRIKTLEALKSEMRRMIRAYSQVEDVSISVPFIENQSIFIETEIPQTASVVLTLRPGMKLDNEQIRAIRNLIAGGFPGLTEENITLTDQFMRPLIPDDEGEGKLKSRQMAVELETERQLERDIRKVLGPVLGDDKFTVAVNVDFDWDNVQIKAEKYAVPGFEQYKLSEQTEDEKLKGEGVRPGGEPGVSSNSPPVYNAIGRTGPIDYSRSEKIVNYLSDKTTTERIQSPYVKRISAAVAVDGIWKEKEDTSGKIVREYIPRSQQELEHIKALVKSALGNSPERNDLVEVRNIPWDRTKEFAYLDAKRAKEAFRRKMMIYSLLAAPLVILLIVLYLAWRRHVRLKEEELARQRELERQKALAAAEAGLGAEISLEEQERQEIQRRAASLARAKPQVVADLLRTWMAEDTSAAA